MCLYAVLPTCYETTTQISLVTVKGLDIPLHKRLQGHSSDDGTINFSGREQLISLKNVGYLIDFAVLFILRRLPSIYATLT